MRVCLVKGFLDAEHHGKVLFDCLWNGKSKGVGYPAFYLAFLHTANPQQVGLFFFINFVVVVVCLLFVCLSACLPACLPACLFVCLFVCLFCCCCVCVFSSHYFILSSKLLFKGIGTVTSLGSDRVSNGPPFSSFSVNLRPQRSYGLLGTGKEPRTATSTFTRLLSSDSLATSLLLYVYRNRTDYYDVHLDRRSVCGHPKTSHL